MNKYVAFLAKRMVLGICMLPRLVFDVFTIPFKKKNPNNINVKHLYISGENAYYVELNKDEFTPKVKYLANQTIARYARSHKKEIVINAGLFNLYNGKPYGPLISEGKNYFNNPFIKDDNGAPLSDEECHPLIIDNNNDFKILSLNRKLKENKASEIVKNYPNAITGWGAMIIDSKKTDFINQELVWGKDQKIRQIIGQLENGNYFILSCDNAFYNDIYDYLSDKNVSFAYSLDGGRSTRLFINGKQINVKSKRYYIPSIIIFKKNKK